MVEDLIEDKHLNRAARRRLSRNWRRFAQRKEHNEDKRPVY